jgi:hypothetical protein
VNPDVPIGVHYYHDGDVVVGEYKGDHLLYLHADSTVSIGRDVTGEWSEHGVRLSSPHTGGAYLYAHESSAFMGPEIGVVPQLPILRLLLDDPTLRISLKGWFVPKEGDASP